MGTPSLFLASSAAPVPHVFRNFSLSPPLPFVSRTPPGKTGSTHPLSRTTGGCGGGSSAGGRVPPPLPPRIKSRHDRDALLELFYECSPSPPTNQPSSGSGPGWQISTGWGAPISMNRWYGVSTHYENGVQTTGNERVTGLVLIMNGLCGEMIEGKKEIPGIFSSRMCALLQQV